MRILHVYSDYAPFTQGGGVERYIHHLCSYFIGNGHEVAVAARHADIGGVAPYRLMRAALPELLREIRAADRVHIHGPRNAYSAIAGLMAYMSGVPFFYTLHCFYTGKTTLQKLQKFLWDHSVERFLLSYARRAIVLSDHWRHYLTRHHLPTLQLHILPNGIDVAGLRAAVPAPYPLAGTPAILTVSRLDPVKSIEDIIAALARPGMENAHLHIVGRGDDAPRLQQIAAQQNAAHRVTFHGFKSDDEIAAMARAADVFVLASAEEGMPTVLLEMLARKRPVVASAIPGNLSLTIALDWPHTYPLHDIAALAVTMQSARAASVTDALVERLEQLFDWSVIGRSMLALYEAPQ